MGTTTTRQVVVDVTQEDIDRGERMSCSRCPLAFALSRALEVPVLIGHTLFGPVGGWEAVLSMEAEWFIDKFDAGRPVVPFSFIQRVPVSESPTERRA